MGVLHTIYQDVNPNSPSFGEEREETYEDPIRCPENTATWTLVSSYCETTSTGNNSGFRIDLYQDTNPDSETYMSTYTESVYDITTCPIADESPIWVEVSYSCQIITYSPSGVQGTNGYAEVLYSDDNPVSPTNGETKIEIEPMDECQAPDTSPNWINLSDYCIGEGVRAFEQQDDNVYSSSYGETRTIEREDVTC